MNTIKSPNPDNIHWSENIIIADADYIDYVAFNLIVNFERMLGRRIPPADLSRWAMDIALDGGLREEARNAGSPHPRKGEDGTGEFPSGNVRH